MVVFSRILLAGVSLAAVACASHNRSLDEDAATPVAVRATLRVVNAETTWVADGDSYELIARSRPEIAAFESALDRLAATLHRVFPKDSLPHLTATVRRVSGEGQSFTGPAPVPGETKGAVVELTIVDARHDGGEEQRARALGGRIADERVRPVLRAWLAAHAAAVSGNPARYSQLTGEADDPRVPAWAFEMLPLLGDSAATERLTRLLAAHPDALIPLAQYFAMAAPAYAGTAEKGAREGSGNAGRGGGGARGGGGMGGGMGRGGGRRGRGGGAPSGGEGERASAPPLEGLALYAAESAALGRYLSREGDDLIGQLVDAQVQGQPLDGVLSARGLGEMPKVESDWRYWVSQHASTENR